MGADELLHVKANLYVVHSATNYLLTVGHAAV